MLRGPNPTKSGLPSSSSQLDSRIENQAEPTLGERTLGRAQRSLAVMTSKAPPSRLGHPLGAPNRASDGNGTHQPLEQNGSFPSANAGHRRRCLLRLPDRATWTQAGPGSSPRRVPGPALASARPAPQRPAAGLDDHALTRARTHPGNRDHIESRMSPIWTSQSGPLDLGGWTTGSALCRPLVGRFRLVMLEKSSWPGRGALLGLQLA